MAVVESGCQLVCLEAVEEAGLVAGARLLYMDGSRQEKVEGECPTAGMEVD